MPFGFAAAAVALAVIGVGYLLTDSGQAGSGQAGTEAQATPVAVSVTGSRHGMTGQIIGIGGMCLDSKDKSSNSSSVILTTCIGNGKQQEWTIRSNREIVLNGQCLGVATASGKSGSTVGLYSCTGAKPETWQVESDHTIRNVSSGLCLGSWKNKDTNGVPVWVTACQPTVKAQLWTVPNTAVDPSGLAMPVGNIPGWRQAFTDNFTENVPIGQFPAKVSGKWGDYPDGWLDTSHHGVYEPTKVVSIENGVMNMFLHTQDGKHMVATPYPKVPGATGPAGGSVYGIYEVRFTAQQVAGYKTAWLLWPDSNNQTKGGEIDFPEGALNGIMQAFMHHVGSSGPKVQQDIYPTSVTYAGWHTATTIWTANSVIFELDGKVIGDSKDPAVIPHTPMHWLLQTETRTNFKQPSNTATANVKIDWVSVWLPQQK